jgi:hypothetical protein
MGSKTERGLQSASIPALFSHKNHLPRRNATTQKIATLNNAC